MPNAASLARRHRRMLRRCGAPVEDEGWRLRKDHSRFWAEVAITPLRDDHNQLRGFSKVTRDITVRKTAEANLLKNMTELNRSNEELEQFASIASRDLQEPLRMVASYTQLLSRRYKGKLGADADEFIAFAVDGAGWMQADPGPARLLAGGLEGAGLARDLEREDALQQALVNLRGAINDSGALVTHDPLPVVLADELQLTLATDGVDAMAFLRKDTDIARSYELRANCYLSKPSQLEDFESLVNSINDFWLTKAKLPPREKNE
ncbi:MAG: PAS domain S-box protein [bacterium]